MAYRKYKRNYQVTKYKKPMRYQVADTAFKAYKIASKIARLVNVEYKTHDVTGPLEFENGGIMTVMSTIPINDTRNGRDGASVKPLSFYLGGKITISSTTRQDAVRIIIFRGNNENQVVPTAVDYLTTVNTFSPKNLENKFHYKKLWDQTFSVSDNGHQTVSFKKHIKLNGHINFKTAGTAIEGGGLYMLIIGTVGASFTDFDFHSRLTFTDN